MIKLSTHKRKLSTKTNESGNEKTVCYGCERRRDRKFRTVGPLHRPYTTDSIVSHELGLEAHSTRYNITPRHPPHSDASALCVPRSASLVMVKCVYFQSDKHILRAPADTMRRKGFGHTIHMVLNESHIR